MDRELWVCRLGTVEYREALGLQHAVRAARQAGAVPDVLLLLEHPPVLTRGRRSAPGELPMGEDWYRMQGTDVVDVDRGGRATFHNPGQLVGYPIVAVDDVVAFVRTLEGAVVTALAGEGLSARTRTDEGADFTGVWVGDAKIASIGVHVQRGVTTHGLAVNVENDLQMFGWFTPCGLDGVQMTSGLKETRALEAGLLPAFCDRLALALAEALGRRREPVSRQRLDDALRASTSTPTPSTSAPSDTPA